VVWAVIAITSAIRVWVIWRSFFWQDDYIHIWTAWNQSPGDLILQNWNGHREPAGYAIQWVLARAAPQVWWPAAVVLSLIAVATTVMFWLMLRRWGGSPAAAMLFAAWPATLVAQQWLSAGLETVTLLLMFVAGFLLARPGRWTPLWVALLASAGWLFHERAGYFAPVLLAIAVFYTGRRAWRDNRWSWIVLLGVTAVALLLRIGDARPGQAGGTSVPGAAWQAGPGSVLRSVLGWLPFDAHTVIPAPIGLYALAVLVVWMGVVLAGLTLAPRQTLLVLSVTAAFFLVEVASFVWLRGSFVGSALASDPRFTLVTGTVLLAGLGSFALPCWIGGLTVLGCWSMLAYPPTPGRDWFPALDDQQLAATPSPPGMLSHFFFTTEPPVYELGTTRTLLQVGPDPPAFPPESRDPQQVGQDGVVGPLQFTPLVVDDRRQCGTVVVPPLAAGVRVVRVGDRYLFPAPGPIPPIPVEGCVDRVEVGIPGR
jgi:hypothetical protein